MTLTGNVIGDSFSLHNIRVLPRSTEHLPAGLEVTDVQLQSQCVKVTVVNHSRQSIIFDHHTVFAELHLTEESECNSVLEALVGPSLESDVFVEGVKASCLIDSGSQVSIVSESFYHKICHMYL